MPCIFIHLSRDFSLYQYFPINHLGLRAEGIIMKIKKRKKGRSPRRKPNLWTRFLRLFTFGAIALVLVVQFQNCGKGEGLNTGNSPSSSPTTQCYNCTNNASMALNVIVVHPETCNLPTSTISQSIIGAGSAANCCLAFILTAPNRLNETHTCDTPDKFVLLSTISDWSYNINTDTWSVPQSPISAWHVPGTFTIYVKGSDGVTVKSWPSYTVKTTGSNPNNCSP